MTTPLQCMDCAHRIANQKVPGYNGTVDLCDIDMGDHAKVDGDAWLDPGGHVVMHPCGFCENTHPATQWHPSQLCTYYEGWDELYDNPEAARSELSESTGR